MLYEGFQCRTSCLNKQPLFTVGTVQFIAQVRKRHMVKKPNWQEADWQLVIYKRDREVEVKATEKQLQLMVRA